MTQKQYKLELKNHDWFYYQSDSRVTYDRGYEEERKLKLLWKENPAFKELYDSYRKHILKRLK